ncbi:MAG: hypothetical protein PHH11_08765 [Methylomonas sp.]|nr:hypothetical protein [Methylomonas sp.]
MQHPKTLLAAGLLLSAASLNAQASLTSYTANGVDFVRMQGAGFDLSFTKDGNLFQTLANSYAGGASSFVTAVIDASGGKITDTPNAYDSPANSGYHTLTSSDFNTSTGSVSWFGAKAYVNYLNSVSYGGSHQWALPTWTDTGASGPQYANSGTDAGYNINPSTDPLAQLYFGELSKKAYLDTSGNIQNGYGIFGNDGAQVAGGAVGPFTNVQSYAYWLGTEYAPYPDDAWYFITSYGGFQYGNFKDRPLYAWAVSPGLVASAPAAVPVPGAVWQFGTGLLGLLGLLNRRKA